MSQELFPVPERSRNALYLPMVPEAAVATLACARIGAVKSLIGERQNIAEEAQ